MKRRGFLKSLIGVVPAVALIGNSEDKVAVPRWILSRFNNEDQIGTERCYHDSEFLFPESDHTKVMVSKDFFSPWSMDTYPAYKGTMYRFKIDKKYQLPMKRLLPYFSRNHQSNELSK